MVKEEEIVTSRSVSCEGQDLTGHPKVYLEIPHDDDHIACPYCNKKFILKISH
ncbi:MAG: zinc-finger domain-containing protein [Rickettsiales bacterium]